MHVVLIHLTIGPSLIKLLYNVEKIPQKAETFDVPSFISCKFQPKCILVEGGSKWSSGYLYEVKNVKILKKIRFF